MNYKSYPKNKDSGIKGLGEIPEHWEVRRLKHLGTIRYGLGEPPSPKDDGLPFIRATDIHRGRINGETVQRVDPADVPWSRAPQLKLKPDDILVVRSGAYTGDSAIIPEEWTGAIAGYDLVLTVTKAVPKFIAFVLLSKYLLQGQIYLAKMRAAQPHLNAEELGECVVVFPPSGEQRAIAAFLVRETARIDALLEKIRKSIDLLREYRTALITAAVTGKIDVRNNKINNRGSNGRFEAISNNE
jgi:type I restriction enzyme S subunit